MRLSWNSSVLPCFLSLRKDLAEEAGLKLRQTCQWILGLWVNWLEKNPNPKQFDRGEGEGLCCRKQLWQSPFLALMECPSHSKVVSQDLLWPWYLAGCCWFFLTCKENGGVTRFCCQDWQCLDILFSCLRRQWLLTFPVLLLSCSALRGIGRLLSSPSSFFSS